MPQAEIQRLKLDSGGFINPQFPENQQALAQIQATPALTAANLLKMATFHGQYATNKDLANSLASSAMQRLTRNPQFKTVLAQHGATIIDGSPLNEVADRWEDFWNGPIDSEDASEHQPGYLPIWPTVMDIRWLPVATLIAGLGLLIQADTNNPPSFFVIGICPDPASLPD
jgi:hypothetical protein